VRQQLQAILGSHPFVTAVRARRFLTHIVNPDCTGLIVLKFGSSDAAPVSHAAFALGGSGKTIYAIVVDAAPNTNSLTFTRVGRTRP